ncbi:histidine phosphatase family protein [Streptomyces sp. TR06-5]|uniref:histidine phosphatase family protein n=1 Tax=unclassified Streptomyces TaxID=2593676 RepID=UPI0039A0394D
MGVRVTLLSAARSSSVLDVRFGDDRPLDGAGRAEVRRAAPGFASLCTAELRYCSPTARCRETCEGVGVDAIAQPALRDCDMGRWRGSTLHEVAARDPGGVDVWLADPYAAPHGGEPLMSFISRVGSWLDTRPAAAGDRVVAVAEPGVVRAALCYVLRVPPHVYWRVDARPLSAVVFAGRAGEWRLSLA